MHTPSIAFRHLCRKPVLGVCEPCSHRDEQVGQALFVRGTQHCAFGGREGGIGRRRGRGAGICLSHPCLKEAATTALFGVLNQSARHLRTLSPTSSSSYYLKGECFCIYSKHAVTNSLAIQNVLTTSVDIQNALTTLVVIRNALTTSVDIQRTLCKTIVTLSVTPVQLERVNLPGSRGWRYTCHCEALGSHLEMRRSKKKVCM